MDDTRLLLIAHDADDVPPISALVQSAAVRVADIGRDLRRRRLAMLISRYRWEADDISRVRCVLRFDSVLHVARRDWPAGDAVLELLACTFDGAVFTLAFAGGATLRIEVECPDVTLEDVSAPWAASRQPRHG